MCHLFWFVIHLILKVLCFFSRRWVPFLAARDGKRIPNISEASLLGLTRFLLAPKETFILGGGLKYFLFSPLLGEMIQFD